MPYANRSRSLHMTRMHFEAIAGLLNGQRPAKGGKTAREYAAWRAMVIEFGNLCCGSNGRFDRQKFYEACGYKEGT